MAQAIAADPRGLKRICMSCGTRFYDMNKRPINCPSCATEFSGEFKVKTRRSRLSPIEADGPVDEATAVEVEADVVEEEEIEATETVSLEDVEPDADADAEEEDALTIDDVEDLDDEDDIDVEVEDDEDEK